MNVVTGLWLQYRMMAVRAGHLPTLSWDGPQRIWAMMMASLPSLTEMAHAQRPCIDGWDGPLGLIHAADPARASTVGSSMAVAIATALTPGATIDTVIAKVVEHAGSLGLERGFFFVPRLQRLLEIAGDCRDVFDLREPFYKEFLVTFPPFDLVFSLEMVPCALALCVIAKGDFEQAVIGAANMGRDADTIGALAGELMGTLVGADAIPRVGRAGGASQPRARSRLDGDGPDRGDRGRRAAPGRPDSRDPFTRALTLLAR